jgi:hypothetical protein
MSLRSFAPHTLNGTAEVVGFCGGVICQNWAGGLQNEVRSQVFGRRLGKVFLCFADNWFEDRAPPLRGVLADYGDVSKVCM